MLLAIDVGNTQTVVGIYQDGSLQYRWRVATNKSHTADEVRIKLLPLFESAGLSFAEVRGAALATILSQFVSFALLWIGVQRSGSLSIRAKNFRPTKTLYLQILNGGTPSLLRQSFAVVQRSVRNERIKRRTRRRRCWIYCVRKRTAV